ncbi:MAG: type II secretion system protein [Candidatus Nanosyncoccaceae bacterium]|jgi:prepilin-type N-terminal cleavage/methylation domain-containing protein
MNKRTKKLGFSMVELLVVIVILSTFALLGSFGYNKLKEHQIKERARTNAEGVSSALNEIYMAGQTVDGVQGKKGEYPSIQDTCIKSNSIISQIIQKQKSVDKDVKVAFLSATNSEKFSQDMSGCEVLSNGEISTDCVSGISGSAKLLSCSSSKEEIDASDEENIGTVIYQPITNVKSLPGHVNTSNMAWQCLGEGYVTAMPSPSLPGEMEDVTITNPVSCRGFYVYFLEKSGSKIKLSEAITGKY